MKFSYIKIILFGVIILIVFRAWFLPGLIASGDLEYLWNYDFFSLHPFSWNIKAGEGLGVFFVPYLWVYMVLSIPFNLAKLLNIPWDTAQRMILFYPFIGISVFSSILFLKKIFPSNRFYLFSTLIFTMNTYILNIVAGGQLVFALAYALAPITLLFAINIIDKGRFRIRKIIIYGLLLSLQVMIDIRVGYILFVAISLYLILDGIIERRQVKNIIKNSLNVFILPCLILVLTNAFWILPTLIFGTSPAGQLGVNYPTEESVRFFSFAKLENTISLLHPNWPENIFGKAYFMKPEFLLLPILAYSSLLFVSKIKNRKSKIYIIYFVLLGLIGAFLAKGANEPFGGIYLWLFDNFPGFIMFRDSTKWYALVAVSYSILIPFTVWKIYKLLKSQLSPGGELYFVQKIQKFIPKLFLILTFILLIFLIHPAFLGQLTGSFKHTQMPEDYKKLEKFLSSQNNFSRTFWVPQIQRFGFYSNSNPAISGKVFFNISSSENFLSKLRESQEMLENSAVRYVIVPYDSEGEIFLEDRKYNEELYLATVKKVEEIEWLKRVESFGEIAVFEVPNPKGHFWTDSSSLKINYRYLEPTRYEIDIKNAKEDDLIVFSESFDSNWLAKKKDAIGIDSGELIQSSAYDERFNSFKLKSGGDYTLEIFYLPQKWVNIGLFVSGATLIISFIIIVYTYRKK